MAVYVNQSNIPQAGQGLFVHRDYEKGEIIGQYFGRHLLPGEKPDRGTENYIYETEMGFSIQPFPHCLCRFINDALNLEATAEESLEELLSLPSKTPLGRKLIAKIVKDRLKNCPVTWEDKDEDVYNVDWREDEKTAIVYIVATRRIEETEELYIPYGWFYWQEIVSQMVEEKLALLALQALSLMEE